MTDELSTLDLGTSLVERSLMKRTELVYIGFNDNNADDKKYKEQLQKAWKKSIQLMSYQNAAGYNNAIFKHYFDPAAAGDVKKVFDNMWGGNDDKGSLNLGSIIVDNQDFENSCVANKNRLCYTRNEYKNGVLNVARIHCCMKERASKVPEIDDIKCENLGNMVTYKMLTLSAALLHEYT